ncbi:MAG: transglutaminaseTgpA domain-containing protein [Acidimicrobiia bacterium]
MQPEAVISLRISVCIAVMTSAAAALIEGAGGGLLWVAVVVGFPLAFGIGYWVRETRPLALRAAQSVVAIVILVAFMGRITTVTDLGSLQIPLAQSFLWLLLLHALDTPNRRGLMVLLVASLVLVSLAGVLSISMAIAPWLLAWGFAALASLVLAYRAELAELPALGGGAPPRFEFSSLLVPLGVLVTVLAIGFGVFMVVPVAGTNRALIFPSQLPGGTPVRSNGALTNPSLGNNDPNPSKNGKGTGAASSSGYFGFSNRLDTATRGRPGNSLVMRVRANSPDFWKAQTFDQWDGRVWHLSDDHPQLIRGTQPIFIPRVPLDGPTQSAVDVDELVQTYFLETSGPNSIFAANQANKVYFPERSLFQNPDGTLRAGVRLDAGSVYTVVSERPLVTADVLRSSNPASLPTDIRLQYAQPPVTTDRVRALAHTITAHAVTAFDKARAIEDWLGAHTKYSLNIPPLPKGKDAVDQYVFVDRRGFCEQIGTTLVVMLRELGIPARLAVGYAPGERNPFTGLYEVKASDAHAWADVYFPGVGWQAFDPTAHVPLAGDAQLDAAGAGALDYLSSRLHIPSEALAAISIGGGFIGLWFAVRGVRRRPRRIAISRSWASTRLARLEVLGARRGRPRAPSESTPNFVRALGTFATDRAADLERVGSTIDAAMFAPDPPDAAVRNAVDELIATIEADWPQTGHPEDLVPSR